MGIKRRADTLLAKPRLDLGSWRVPKFGAVSLRMYSPASRLDVLMSSPRTPAISFSSCIHSCQTFQIRRNEDEIHTYLVSLCKTCGASRSSSMNFLMSYMRASTSRYVAICLARTWGSLGKCRVSDQGMWTTHGIRTMTSQDRTLGCHFDPQGPHSVPVGLGSCCPRTCPTRKRCGSWGRGCTRGKTI